GLHLILGKLIYKLTFDDVNRELLANTPDLLKLIVNSQNTFSSHFVIMDIMMKLTRRLSSSNKATEIINDIDKIDKEIKVVSDKVDDIVKDLDDDIESDRLRKEEERKAAEEAERLRKEEEERKAAEE